MKKFSGLVNYVTLKYSDCSVVATNDFPVSVYAEDRTEAVSKMADVGQAVARSANNTDFAVFYRVINIEEIGA